MNKAVPWSIKGIDFDVREAAKEAARRDGLTLGEWMNRAIADRAVEIGADAQEFDADERLEAVAAQLARLSHEMEENSPPQRRRGEIGREQAREPFAAPPERAPWDKAFIRPPAAGRHPAPPQERARAKSAPREVFAREAEDSANRPHTLGGRETVPAEALLEQAVSAFQQQAGRVEAGAARAIANVATLIESAETVRADALAQVDARLAEIEQKLRRGSQDRGQDGDKRDGKDGVKPSQETISSLQQRLAEVEFRLPKAEPVPGASGGEPALRQSDSRLASLLARLEKAETAPPEPPREKPYAGLEQRFDALLARLERPNPRPAPLALKGGLDGAISEIATRQRELDAGAGVEKDLRNLTGKVEAALSAPSAAGPADLEKLRSELGASGRALADAAPQGAVPHLESAMRDLGHRVEKALDAMKRASETPSPPALSGEIEVLARQVAAMSHALEDVAPRSRMESLENAVLALGDRIERLRLDGMREGVLAPIETLAEELRRAVNEAGAIANFEGGVRQLRDVEEGIQHLRQVSVVNRADLLKTREQSEQLRAMFADAVEQLQPLQRIEKQVADLQEKLVHAAHLTRDAGRGVETRLDNLAQRVEQVATERTATRESDDSRFDDLSRRLDFVHQALAARIDGARDEARQTPPTLEPLLRALAEKLDAATASKADSRALEALERQVTQVSERLDRGDPQMGPRLERAIEDLAQKFEASRQSEREIFRETLAEFSLPARDEDTVREIADLREKHNSSDRRAQQTLSAVHETLEKVVDRLAMLEEDVIESRAVDPERVSAKAAAAPAPATRPLAPAYDFDDDDFLMEPGAGRPLERPQAASGDDGQEDGEASVEMASPPQDEAELASRPAKTNYIDVARRAIAARVAAEQAEAERYTTASAADAAVERSEFVPPRAKGEAAAGRRLPALVLTAVAMLALGAVQAYRMFDIAPPPMQSVIESGAENSQPAAENAPAQLAPAASAAPSPAAPAVAPAPAAPAQNSAPQNSAPRNSAPQASAPETSAPAAPAPKAAPGSGLLDPTAVGTIPPRANSVDAVQNGAQIAMLQQLADKGDAAAQYDLAARFAEGRGIGRDPAAAKGWFEKAAEKGLAQAQFRLGAIYEKGIGATRDAGKARDYYEKAAAQGNVRAMHNLAVVAAEGVEGKPDYAAAAQWFRRAAEYGVRDSQFNLAILYARGMGVSQDLAQSYAWFAIAAQQGDEDAARKRDEVGARLDAPALESARKQADEFHARTPAASSNDPPAVVGRTSTAVFKAPPVRAATWSKF
jgi:localization factor PodJL